MNITTIKDCQILSIPTVKDPRGNLAILEKTTLPYFIKRVYYLHDVPSTASRGGHAHKEQQEFLIAVSGSFIVVINDGKDKKRIMLNKPDKGLLITKGIWRELEDFSSGAVCLVISSGEYDEEDYIRNYDDYLLTKSS